MSDSDESAQEETRCGFAALVGAPNAGKSTLLNQLVGAKVSIVSRKAQTTRALVRGIAIEGATQIILVDTPGIFKPKRRLDRAMVASALSGAADADVIALLIDSRKGVDEEVEAILDAASARQGAEASRPKQDRPHSPREAAFARADAQRRADIRRNLHDLGAERRRR